MPDVKNMLAYLRDKFIRQKNAPVGNPSESNSTEEIDEPPPQITEENRRETEEAEAFFLEQYAKSYDETRAELEKYWEWRKGLKDEDRRDTSNQDNE